MINYRLTHWFRKALQVRFNSLDLVRQVACSAITFSPTIFKTHFMRISLLLVLSLQLLVAIQVFSQNVGIGT
jgi:hypothetical protein